MTGLRITRSLVGPTLRATRQIPLLVGATLAAALVVAPAAGGTDLDVGSWAGLLRFAAMIAALGVTFVLDDPSAATTSVLPVSRALRYALRVAVAVPASVLGWLAAATAGHQVAVSHVSTPLRLPALTLEAATIFVLAVAITVGVARLRPDGSIGVVAAPVYLIVVGALYALPGRAALFVATTSAQWDEVHQIWGLLLIVSTSAAFLLAREPASRRRRGHPRVGNQTIRSDDPRVNAIS
ncbi:hypothetical protein [Frankia sp. AgB32]|uniref:hypothetical protein n=1 Tax=Frankia sp. AgB32 TaxID=631119 RepID=UPI00200BD893|nr:hypothetical protein [Frankia sp. AgB32]MCK9897293.1 hypothetical protein [Frankia sp. AgB32]